MESGSRCISLVAMCVLLMLAVACARADDPPPAEKNLVANPSFEQAGLSTLPEGWHGDPQIFATDREVHHHGAASLRYSNDQPDRYRLCTQKVPVTPGWKCRIGVWVKTKEIQGSESGATICLEWQGKNGKWLGGCYPSGIKGTRDWTRIEEITRVPADGTSCTIGCYVRRGMTGTAWFDEVEVTRVVDPPMQTMLRSPVYRGRITAVGPDEAQVRVRLNLAEHDLKPENVWLECRLQQEAGGKARWESTVPGSAAQEGLLDICVPVRGLAAGRYDLVLRLLGPQNRPLQTARHTLTRVPDDFHARCAIDERGRLLLGGKPFFPLGMYFTAIKEADLKVYADSKFNCMMPYGSPTREQMDLAQQHGLKVIYSIKDWYAGSHYCPKSIRTAADEEPLVRDRVRQFRDHPALLAWYLNDELSQQFIPRLEAHHRWVAEEDPQHPTWSVLYQFREVREYRNTFDVIGTDPYPIGRSPASMAADWTAETFRQVERSRPMWQVPQAHNWANYAKTPAERQRGHTPSYDELRSMAWQCICEGATGLVFYSWYDLQRNPDVPFPVQWDGLKKIAAEVDGLAPALLSAEPVPPVTVEGGESSKETPRWLHWLARRHGGKIYLFAVNDGDGEGTVRFQLPARPRSVRVLGEDRSVSLEGKAFEDGFGRLAVHIYEFEPTRE